MKFQCLAYQSASNAFAVVIFSAALLCNVRLSVAQQTAGLAAALGDPRVDAMSFDVWRKERRIIDLHQHIEAAPERFQRAIGILDRSGVGIGVILGAGTVTAKDGQTSDFGEIIFLFLAFFLNKLLFFLVIIFFYFSSHNLTTSTLTFNLRVLGKFDLNSSVKNREDCFKNSQC